MKKIFFLAIMITASLLSFSQTLETAKNLLVLQKYKQAKEELDKYKGASTLELYILKTAIYSGLANEVGIKGTVQSTELLAAAETAFKTYRQVDPAMKLLSDAAYHEAPVNLYTIYYTAAYNDYTAKNWSSAYSKIKKAVEYSDLMIQKKIMSNSLDTNLIVLAGIISEKNGSNDDAVTYYRRLADNNIKGEGFESVYRFLVINYFTKNDMVLFEKYKKIGASAYPASEYFKYDKIDFAVGLEENFNAKMKALEKILLTDAGSYKANEVMGELIYDVLNPTDTTKKLPANAAELEKKMIDAFKKAALAKPDAESPFLFMGDHFIDKAVRINDARNKLLSDVAKAAALEKDYAVALYAAKEPYEKAAAIFAARSTLANKDKLQYKKAANYLADIASYKKMKAKGNAAEQKKWVDEEAKWIAVAASVK